MSADSGNELAFCRRRVIENDPWFNLHSVFVSGQRKQQVLALHALFAMLERALSLSEVELSLGQLGWWQSELAPEQARVSAHPVVRALRRSGALEMLDQGIIAALLAQAIERLQTEAISDEAQLRSLCDRIGRAYVSAECAIAPVERTSATASVHCPGTGLSTLVFSALRAESPSFWFLPLTLQARYKCDARTIATGSNEAESALAALGSLGSEWFGTQIGQMRKPEPGLPTKSPSRRHLFAWILCDRLRSARNLQVLAQGQPGMVATWRLSDFMSVWAACRKIGSAGESSQES